MNPEAPEGRPEYTAWDEHVYASLRWTEGSIRRLHELLEYETVDDELRGKVTAAISWIEAARLQAFHAFEKMGGCAAEANPARLGVSSIGDETKVKVLELNAAFLEALLLTKEAKTGYDSLLGVVQAAIRTLKEEAAGISERLRKELGGPPEA